MSSSVFRSNAERVVAKVMDGEAIVIDIISGTYYSLTDAGGYIWQLMESGCAVDEIRQRIAAEYGIAYDVVSADVDALLRQLLDERVIVPAANGSAESSAASVAIARPSDQAVPTYRTPELQIFRDMQDLLALDPPMPGLQDIHWK